MSSSYFRVISGDLAAVSFIPEILGDASPSLLVGKVRILNPKARVRFEVKFFPQIEFDPRGPAPKDTAASLILEASFMSVSNIVEGLSRYL